MLYANKEIIVKSECTENGIRVPGNCVRSGNRINAVLMKDGDVFLDLYHLWLDSCTEKMRILNKEEPEENFLPLFYENSDRKKGELFLERFIKFIKGKAPYDKDGRGIWPDCPEKRICKQVDHDLQDVPDYIRLRVKVICILLGNIPEKVFAEGISWAEVFLPDMVSDDILEVEDGAEFLLSFDHVKSLFPKTLYNNSDNCCTIRVAYGEISYSVHLPAHGFLRAVFGDEECKCLVSVKGNISFNASETRNAIIQLPGKHPSLVMYHECHENPFGLETCGAFLDAAADGNGGAAVLKTNGIYYTGRDKLEEEENAIRVYGAGRFRAVQYADGTIKCNMRKEDGSPVREALAVVENEDCSLMIRDGSGAWDCSGGIAGKISDGYFVQCMMERFLCKDACEKVENSVVSLRINRNGKLEAK